MAQAAPMKPYYPEELERRILSAVLSGNRPGAMRYLDSFLRSVLSGTGQLDHLRSYVLQLQIVLLRKCRQAGVDTEGQLCEVATYARAVLTASPGDLRRMTQQLIDELLDMVVCLKSSNRLRTMEMACRYIRSNFHRNLPMQEVAGIVNMGYHYFSRLFARYTGMTYRDFLIEVRLQRAKELLSVSELNLEEIARQVGYSDASHFSRVFKSRTGMSPRRFASLRGIAQVS
ncbi:MAG TPA: AraC family transcriptional regulator [Dehalococcoidia bacterium]|nr:AraC family transcriptional regulator [Dehalococcoidia bacterium]